MAFFNHENAKVMSRHAFNKFSHSKGRKRIIYIECLIENRLCVEMAVGK